MPPITAQGRLGPVVVYAPNRRVPARAAPTRRTNATNPQAPIDPNVLERAIGQARQSQAQRQAEEEQKAEFAQSFWGHGFGQTLGTVIKPLSALSVPMKLVQLGREEGAKLLPDWAEVVAGGPLLFAPIDEERTGKDTRSNWEKLSPTSTYGAGEIQKSTGNEWADRALGFLGDVAFDPLTYVTGGATKLGVEAEKVGAEVATRALAEGASEEAAQAAARAATRKLRTIVPHNAPERLQYISERVLNNPELATKFAPDIEKGLKQGLTRMSPEARQAFGDISKPGLYVRGTGGRVRLPLSGLAGEAVARGGAASRNLLARVPAEPGTKLGTLRNLRVPEGTEELYNTTIRGQGGDMVNALLTHAGRQSYRAGEGAATALGNRTLSQFFKDNIKGIGKGRVRQAFVEAETSPQVNPINQMFADVLHSFEEVAGRSIDPDYLRDPATYVPHILAPEFRRVLKSAIATGDEKALAFAKATGFTSDDLLENSGFLAEARTMTTGAEIKMGDHTIRIPDGTIPGLNANEDLRAAFPGFKGKFFMDDPVQIGEAYASSLGRQAGKEYAINNLVAAATKFGRGGVVEGPLAEALRASQAARAAQDPRIAVIEAGFQPSGTGRPDWLEWAGEDPIAYGFKGEKGSTYVVRPDGTSVRNRAVGARGDAVMPGDTELAGGVQEAFDRVAFLSEDDALKVSRASAAGIKPVDEQGRLVGLTMDNTDFNVETFNRARNSGMRQFDAAVAAGAKPIIEPVAMSHVPEVGKTPFEYMLNGSKVHPGHPVVEVFDAAKAPKPGAVLADIGPTPVIPGSAQDIADRQAYAAWQAAGSVGEPPGPPRPAYEAAGINPEDYFSGKVSESLTTQRNDLVMQQGKKLVNAVRKDAEQAESRARSFLSGIKKNLMRGLGKSLKEDAPRIKLLDERLDNAAKRLAQINVQRPQDQADLVQMIFESRQVQRDLEAELKTTEASFDALNKKTTKKVVAKMQSQLRTLKKLHTDAVHKMETMPARMRAEANARLKALEQPIRDAEEALERKTATVEGAVSDEAYRAAQATVRTAGMNSAEYDQLIENWELAVNNHTELLLNAPRRNGKLTTEGKRMLDLAAANEQEAWKRITIGPKDPVTGGRVGQAEIPKADSPYLHAQTRLKQIEAQLSAGRRDGVAPIEPVQVFIEEPPVQGPTLPNTVTAQMEATGFEYRVGQGWVSDDLYNIAKQVRVYKPSQVADEMWAHLEELAEQTARGAPGRRVERVGQNITETFWNVDHMGGRVRWEANSPAEAFAKVQEHRAMQAAEALRRSMRDAKGRFIKRGVTPQQADINAIDTELDALAAKQYLSPQEAQRKIDLTARKKGLQGRRSMTGAEAEAARAAKAKPAVPAVPEPPPVAPEVQVNVPQLEPAEWAHTRDILQDELLTAVDEANLDQVDAIYTLSDQDTATFVQQMWPDLPDTAKHRLGELGWTEADRSSFDEVWQQFMDAPPADGFVGAVRSGSEYQAYRRFLADLLEDEAILGMTQKDIRKLIRDNFDDLPEEFQQFYTLRDTTVGETPAAARTSARAARRRAARNVEQSVEDAAAELGETPIGELTPNILTDAETKALEAERRSILRKMRRGGSLWDERHAWDTIFNRLKWEKDVAAATGTERAAVAKARAFADQVQESMIFRRVDTPPSMERIYPGTVPATPATMPRPETGIPIPRRTASGELGRLQARIKALLAKEELLSPGQRQELRAARKRVEDILAGEQIGFGVGEERIPVEVGGPGGTGAPEPEAFQDVLLDPTTHQVVEAAPSPRTEREAITALTHAADFTGAERAPGGGWVNPVDEYQRRIDQTHAILADPSVEAGRINQAARDEATSEIQAAMEATAADYGTDITNLRGRLNAMDDETLALRYRTQEDLKDVTPLKEKRESLTVWRDTVKAADPNRRILDLEDTLSDIADVARANPDMLDRDMTIVESLLNQHAENLARTAKNRSTAKDIASMVERPDKLAKMTVVTLNDQFRLLHNGVVGEGSQFLDKELYRMFTNTYQIANEPTLFGRVFNAITNVWKTYATLSPGFQIRNALSGIFMNTADGVPLRIQLEGALKWREFVKAKNPREWLAAQPEDIRQAFHAASGAGAGGRFTEAGFAQAGSSRDWWNAVMSNKATRWAQRFGSNVEGSLRLPAALDSIRRGDSVTAAMSRVTKLHFDYGQVSKLDKYAKRIFPFWTFMSRNLPLQIEMMWTKPRAYAYYESFKRNFQQPPDPFTPDYWNRLGAWNTGLKNPLSGTSVYVQPDFGFTRVESDVKDVLDFVTNKRPGALLSNVNPLLSAPFDYYNGRDSFYNRSFGPEDYRARGGLPAAPINLLANNPLGQALNITNEQGEISDNFWNLYTSLNPVADRLNRLFPTASGGDTARTAESWQRFLGLPPYVRTLSPTLQKSEFYRQKDEAMSKIKAQRAAIERMLQAAG
jgi:hypothetical protein